MVSAALRRIGRPSFLYARLIVSVALVCLAVVGLDGWRTWENRATHIAEDKAETANLARSLAQHAHDTIQAADTAVIGLRDAVEAVGFTPEALARQSRLMAMQAATSKVIHTLVLLDADGWYVGHSLPETAGAFNGSGRAYFRHHRTHPDRGSHVGDPVRSNLDGRWVITVSRRLNAPDGSFAGVAVATISVDVLQGFYATFDVGQDGAIALETSGGILVARKPADNAAVGTDMSRSQLNQMLQPHMPSGSFQYVSSLDGIRRLGSYHRVDDFPLMVIVAHGLQETLRQWRTDALIHFCISLSSAACLAWLGYRLAVQFRRLQQAEITTRQSESHYRLLAGNSTDMITQLGPDLRRVYVSPSSNALLGYAPHELLGLHLSVLVSDEDWPAVSASLATAAAQGHAPPVSYRVRRRDGAEIWVETTGRRMEDGSGFVVATRDITQRKAAETSLHQANNKLQRLVMLDGLTGIANRRCFDAVLEREHRRAVRGDMPLALLLIDVDHFKAFNDVYGHPAGDACLRAIAGCIARHMRRPADLTARYGGEEFAVLLPETEIAGALVLAERIRAAVHGLAVVHRENPSQVATVSIGVAVAWPRQDADKPHALVKLADSALYSAKAEGRDRTCCAPDEEAPIPRSGCLVAG